MKTEGLRPEAGDEHPMIHERHEGARITETATGGTPVGRTLSGTRLRQGATTGQALKPREAMQ